MLSPNSYKHILMYDIDGFKRMIENGFDIKFLNNYAFRYALNINDLDLMYYCIKNGSEGVNSSELFQKSLENFNASLLEMAIDYNCENSYIRDSLWTKYQNEDFDFSSQKVIDFFKTLIKYSIYDFTDYKNDRIISILLISEQIDLIDLALSQSQFLEHRLGTSFLDYCLNFSYSRGHLKLFNYLIQNFEFNEFRLVDAFMDFMNRDNLEGLKILDKKGFNFKKHLYLVAELSHDITKEIKHFLITKKFDNVNIK